MSEYSHDHRDGDNPEVARGVFMPVRTVDLEVSGILSFEFPVEAYSSLSMTGHRHNCEREKGTVPGTPNGNHNAPQFV